MYGTRNERLWRGSAACKKNTVKGGSYILHEGVYFSKSEVYLSVSSYAISYFILIKSERMRYHTKE